MTVKLSTYKCFIFIILIFTIVIASSCDSNEVKEEKPLLNNKSNNPAKIEFEKKIHDFGTLKQGEVVEYAFKFKNIGGSALKIQDVSADCGCTVPKYNKNPIPAGKEDKVKIVFNTNGLRNNQYKKIKIKANGTINEISLIITAFIESNY